MRTSKLDLRSFLALFCGELDIQHAAPCQPSSSARFILKCIPLPGTIMVEKFTIADGRQKEGRGRGKPMIERERVEWADRKITGYAEENERERPSEETDTFRTRAECGLRIIAREGKKGNKRNRPSVVPSLLPPPP